MHQLSSAMERPAGFLETNFEAKNSINELELLVVTWAVELLKTMLME